MDVVDRSWIFDVNGRTNEAEFFLNLLDGLLEQQGWAICNILLSQIRKASLQTWIFC